MYKHFSSTKMMMQNTTKEQIEEMCKADKDNNCKLNQFQ